MTDPLNNGTDLNHLRQEFDSAPPYKASAEVRTGYNPPAAANDDIFPLLDLDALDQLKPPEWIVDGLLPEAGNIVVYGLPKTYKSFVVLSWALSIGYGKSWFGRSVKPGAVLYVCAEGTGGMGKRQKAWRLENGLDGAGAPFVVLPLAIDLTSPKTDDAAKLLRTCEACATMAKQPLRLVVIDTKARVTPGVDEDTAKDTGGFVAVVDQIRERFGAAVITVHHAGKAKGNGPRGSNSLPGAVDTLIRCDRDVGTSLVTVTNEMQKDAEEVEPFTLEAAAVDLPEVGATSIVMRWVGDAAEEGEAEDRLSVVAESVVRFMTTADPPKSEASVKDLKPTVKTALNVGDRRAGDLIVEAIPPASSLRREVHVDGQRWGMWIRVEGEHKTAAKTIVIQALD